MAHAAPWRDLVRFARLDDYLELRTKLGSRQPVALALLVQHTRPARALEEWA
jgi:hypothetical protein